MNNTVIPNARAVHLEAERIARIRVAMLRDFMVPLAGGILLGLPFYSEQFNGIAWVALVPIAWALCKRRAGIELYFGAFYGGLAFSLLGLDWIRESYHGRLFDSWIMMGHLLAAFWFGMIWVGRRVTQATRLPMVVVLPMFWIAMEWVRWHVAGIPFEDGLPVLQLGLTQASHDRLIQICSLGGIAAVSWLIAAVNGALFDAFREGLKFRRKDSSVFRIAAPLGGATVLIVATLWYGDRQLNISADEPGPTVCIVSGPFDPIASTKAVRQFRRRVLDCLDEVGTTDSKFGSTYPGLMIWKEGAVSGCTFVDESGASSSDPLVTPHRDDTIESTASSMFNRDDLYAVAREIDSSIIVGCIRQELVGPDEDRYNSVVYVDRDGGLEYYDKIHLAPSSEFRPQLGSALAILPPARTTRTGKSRFRHGRDQHHFQLHLDSRSYSFATMICYDVWFPTEHRRLVGVAGEPTNLDFFVGVANEQPAQDTSLPNLALALQRFRAIECRRAYVRNAEYGVSAIVDSCGRRVPMLCLELSGNRTALIGRVPIDNRGSLYVWFGDWLTVFACVFSGTLFVVALIRPSWRTQNRISIAEQLCQHAHGIASWCRWHYLSRTSKVGPLSKACSNTSSKETRISNPKLK
jgi:apolipoprotein N-acyltransferase